MTGTVESERIAKFLASAGIASRRDVERMIADGRVNVDGRVLDTPAFKVTGHERILVDGVPVGRPDAARLWRYHKPAGLMTTSKDPEGRATVFDSLPKGMPRVMSVGRLDINTEGLLLLTNDGELARAMELPATGLKRSYRARAYGRVDQKELDRLRDGLTHEGETYRSIIATLDRFTGSNCWINVTLSEGKNREVRRALESLGLKVNRLIRVAYGPFVLDDLGPGALQEVEPAELLVQVGRLISDRRRPKASSRGERLRSAPKPSHSPKKRAPSPDPAARKKGIESFLDARTKDSRSRQTRASTGKSVGKGQRSVRSRGGPR